MIYVMSGTSLNYKVAGGTSAPTNPKENTIWVNTSAGINSHTFSATKPYRASKNKNLLVYPCLQTANGSQGITYTKNDDGTYTGNGTATANSFFAITEEGDGLAQITLEPGTYTLSGCPAGGSLEGYKLLISISYDNWANTTYYNEIGSGVTFTLTRPAKAKVTLSVLKDITVTNITFKPQLEKGSTATSFVKGDATGQVWFKTGTSANTPFNMLKKNTAMVYVVSCSQYMDGAWIAKGAKIYQGGEWKTLVNAILYLFDGTTDCTATSGGWEKYSGDGTIAVADGLITLSQTKGSGTSPKDGLFKHKTAVDMTNYNTLTVNTGDISTYVDNRCQIRVYNASNEELATVTLKKGTTEYTLDISEITGECFVVFRFRSFWDGSTHTATSMTISKVKLSI